MMLCMTSITHCLNLFVAVQCTLYQSAQSAIAPFLMLQDEVEIFFSAHGVPVSYVEEAGDPYKEEMEQCISLIMQELQRRHISNHHTLAYQSRVGPVQWLQPYTDTTIK